MLTSTKPRSQQPRASHTTNTSDILLPSSFERPSSQTTIVSPPSSPSPSSPPGARRPSISTTMHWLSRSTTQTSNSSSPYIASKPVRISEPKLVRGIDVLAQPRNGVLGAGAVVVRTPDEALRETGIRLTYDSKAGDEPRLVKSPRPKKEKKASISRTIVPPAPDAADLSPNSPPLPPLPFPESDEERMLSRSSSGSGSRRRSLQHATAASAAPISAQAPVPVSRSPSLRSSLKIRSTSSSDSSQVPPLPSSAPSMPPPPFKAILVSELPAFPVDLENVIVTLETCTTTYKTSLETINSRPCHLAKYINSLLTRRPKPSNSTTSSVYSYSSDGADLAVYRHHLTSQGLLPQPSYNLHLFLDRPSAPYAHILTYLRSSAATPENPEAIPRAVTYQSSSQARLESLIELRDEAAYLDLEGLHKLCVDEIRKAHAAKTHARGISGSGPSSTSIQSLRASVCTLHTLLERVETDARSSSHSLPPESRDKENRLPDSYSGPPTRSPPTPQSWDGYSRDRGATPQRPVRTPPAGWI